jgi:UV DNA damage endonuclease
MIIRFGYVAMSVIVKNASPSKTMTATQFEGIADREAAVRKLERIAEENLHNTLRLLYHNRAHDIQVYRFSSRLIPLIGHEMLEGWNPLPRLAPALKQIGDVVKEQGMRVSFHPEHFTVIATPREDVLVKSVGDLERHVSMLEEMGLDETARCNIISAGRTAAKRKRWSAFFGSFPTWTSGSGLESLWKMTTRHSRLLKRCMLLSSWECRWCWTFIIMR